MDAKRRQVLRRTLLKDPSMGGKTASLEHALREALDALDALETDRDECRGLASHYETETVRLEWEKVGLESDLDEALDMLSLISAVAGLGARETVEATIDTAQRLLGRHGR